MWPEGVHERDFKCVGPASAPMDDPEGHLLNDIVTLGKILVLEADAADVQEFSQDHNDELTTEELMEPQKELNQEESQEHSPGEEEVREDFPFPRKIRDVFGMF
ncbi:unnamed protein product [Schistocephalus solidus]|uniref:Elf-1_N domain-containing protein n=1 Tax=Schistocephalus solidus TaxID=70667 RepID=A0A183SLS8_SCHSO|nr:unnamed protein product [Schistocephalus solidus]